MDNRKFKAWSFRLWSSDFCILYNERARELQSSITFLCTLCEGMQVASLALFYEEQGEQRRPFVENSCVDPWYVVALASALSPFALTLLRRPWGLYLISIQCNLGSARNFAIAFFWNVCCHVERISLDMADCTHFKRKRLKNSARSLNCNEWKSAFSELKSACMTSNV